MGFSKRYKDFDELSKDYLLVDKNYFKTGKISKFDVQNLFRTDVRKTYRDNLKVITNIDVYYKNLFLIVSILDIARYLNTRIPDYDKFLETKITFNDDDKYSFKIDIPRNKLPAITRGIIGKKNNFIKVYAGKGSKNKNENIPQKLRETDYQELLVCSMLSYMRQHHKIKLKEFEYVLPELEKVDTLKYCSDDALKSFKLFVGSYNSDYVVEWLNSAIYSANTITKTFNTKNYYFYHWNKDFILDTIFKKIKEKNNYIFYDRNKWCPADIYLIEDNFNLDQELKKYLQLKNFDDISDFNPFQKIIIFEKLNLFLKEKFKEKVLILVSIKKLLSEGNPIYFNIRSTDTKVNEEIDKLSETLKLYEYTTNRQKIKDLKEDINNIIELKAPEYVLNSSTLKIEFILNYKDSKTKQFKKLFDDYLFDTIGSDRATSNINIVLASKVKTSARFGSTSIQTFGNYRSIPIEKAIKEILKIRKNAFDSATKVIKNKNEIPKISNFDNIEFFLSSEQSNKVMKDLKSLFKIELEDQTKKTYGNFGNYFFSNYLQNLSNHSTQYGYNSVFKTREIAATNIDNLGNALEKKIIYIYKRVQQYELAFVLYTAKTLEKELKNILALGLYSLISSNNLFEYCEKSATFLSKHEYSAPFVLIK